MSENTDPGPDEARPEALAPLEPRRRASPEDPVGPARRLPGGARRPR